MDNRVLIAGGGPTGVSLALCLARLGVPSDVFERRTKPSDHPRAHVVNTRTTELFHIWGIAEQVKAAAHPAKNHPWDAMVPLGGISKAERESLAPHKLCSCAQDLVEEQLHRALSAYPQARVHWQHTVTGFEQDDECIQIQVEGPDGQKVTHKGPYLISAEGYRSRIREQLGIEMVGDPYIGSVMNISFTGRLTPEGVQPGLGGPTADPEVAGAFISMDGDTRWTFQHNYDPEKHKAEDFDAETCRELVRRAAALENADHINIKSIRPWELTALVAERMREERIFLVGDAAHAFPPTGGFGMNSGIQDVHNLAWKLKYVIEGNAPDTLLDSYEAERQAIAYLNTAQSFRNEATYNLRQVDQDYYNDPDFKAMLAKIEEGASQSVRSVAASEADPEKREQIEFLEHFSAIGQDLGYGYDRSTIILSDGIEPPQQTISKYWPTGSPGYRAPHRWLVSAKGERLTTQQVFDGQFSLLSLDAHACWVSAANSFTGAAPVISIHIGPEGDYRLDGDGSSLEELYGIKPEGCVLIRPDGFVAARSQGPVSDPEEWLSTAMEVALGIGTDQAA